MNHQEQLSAIEKYFHSLESQLGYRLLIGGTKHFGLYPPGQESISFSKAQKLMENQLADKLNLPEGSLVLDAGCGEGFVAAHLASEFGLAVTGIDLLEDAISRAIKVHGELIDKELLSFHQRDYSNLNGLVDDNSVDGAFTMETLVHVPNHELALKELFRVLKPGGKLVLFEYSLKEMEKLSEWEKDYTEFILKHSAMHSLRHFTHGKFPEILEQAGFKHVTVENITERTVPMWRSFYKLAWLPHKIIKMIGLEHKFINATAAAVWYPLIKKDLENGNSDNEDYWRYNIVTAYKSK